MVDFYIDNVDEGPDISKEILQTVQNRLSIARLDKHCIHISPHVLVVLFTFKPISMKNVEQQTNNGTNMQQDCM